LVYPFQYFITFCDTVISNFSVGDKDNVFKLFFCDFLGNVLR